MEEKKKRRKLLRVLVVTVLCAAACAAVFCCAKVRRELYRGWEAGKDFAGVWHASVLGQEADWYLTNGRVAVTENGVLPDGDGGYCLVEHGRINSPYTGVFRDDDGTLWYFRNGHTEGVSGLLEDGGTWYLADGGLIAEDFTGLFSGTVDGAEGGWYVHGGRVSAGRTGFIEDGGSWKYVSLGLYDGALTGIRRGVVDGEDALWYVSGGEARTGFTGFAEWNGGYVYIEDGKADDIRFIRGRLKFTDEDGNAADAAPFPSAVVVWCGPGT